SKAWFRIGPQIAQFYADCIYLRNLRINSPHPKSAFRGAALSTESARRRAGETGHTTGTKDGNLPAKSSRRRECSQRNTESFQQWPESCSFLAKTAPTAASLPKFV